MQFETEELVISTDETESVQSITDGVEAVVNASDITDGICLVYCPHTTASVVINENDQALHDDFLERMFAIIPRDGGYQHNETDPDGNAHAHLLTMLLGSSVTLPVIGEVVSLGTWQSILLIELDGPQDRTVIVRLIGT